MEVKLVFRYLSTEIFQRQRKSVYPLPQYEWTVDNLRQL